MVDNSELRRSRLLSVCNIIIFIILTLIGVLFLMSASYDPSVAFTRLTIGLVFIIIAIAILVIISLLIQKGRIKIIKITKGEKMDENIPSDIICAQCGTHINLTPNLRNKKSVICEECGEEVKIPKSSVNW